MRKTKVRRAKKWQDHRQPKAGSTRTLVRSVNAAVTKAMIALEREIPDFLAEPTALAFVAWKKLLTKSPSVLVYWGNGQKRYLDANIARYAVATAHRCRAGHPVAREMLHQRDEERQVLRCHPLLVKG